MKEHDFLRQLHVRGVRIASCGGRLRVEAPVGVLTTADREALAEHKDQLLAALAGRSPSLWSVPGPGSYAGEPEPTAGVARLVDRVQTLIRRAHSNSSEESVAALMEAFEERMAICTVLGGLSQDEAEQVALDQVRRILDNKTSAGILEYNSSMGGHDEQGSE